MTSITKSTPRFYTDGWKDDSTTSGAIVADEIPQHAPRLFLYTKKGPATDQWVAQSTVMNSIYGSGNLTEGGDYFNHQSVFAATCLSNANGMFVHRIIPDDAAKANLGLFAEVVKADFNEYTRDETTGEVSTDVNGNPVTDSSTTVEGMSIRWTVRVLTSDELGGNATTTEGTLTGADGETSTVYPIMEFPAYFYGKYGSNTGFRMWVPISTATDPADSALVDDALTLLYRFQFVERDDASSTPSVIETKNSARYVDISFKDGATNPNNALTYEYQKLNTEYTTIQQGYSPSYGPIDTPTIYKDNIVTILTQAYNYENAWTADSVDSIYMMNIFTGYSWAGTRHETVRPTDDSLEFSSTATHYLLGGDDGTMSDDDFDTLVADELQNGWTRESNPVGDKLHYPFSCMYDSGFSLTTKDLFFEALGYRPDIHVGVCTHVEGATPNDIAGDLSAGQALLTSAKLTPESTVYGTPVVRATMCRSTGEWTSSNYHRTVPLLLDLFAKRCAYMGAGAGAYKTSARYDLRANSYVTELLPSSVTGTFAKDAAADNLWSAGLNGVQWVGRTEIAWVATQSIYTDKTSVMCPDINMMIMVDLVKKADKTWADTAGDSKLTQSQYDQHIEDVFTAYTTGIYDDRVTIEVSAGQTANDELNGFSDTINVSMYANPLRTAQQWNFTAYRASDLTS